MHIRSCSLFLPVFKIRTLVSMNHNLSWRRRSFFIKHLTKRLNKRLPFFEQIFAFVRVGKFFLFWLYLMFCYQSHQLIAAANPYNIKISLIRFSRGSEMKFDRFLLADICRYLKLFSKISLSRSLVWITKLVAFDRWRLARWNTWGYNAIPGKDSSAVLFLCSTYL